MSALSNTALLSVLLAACSAEPGEDHILTGPGSFSARIERGWAEVGFEPLSGATVALDDAAGNRLEAITNDQALVAFNIDWDDGPFDLTVDPGIPGLPLVTAMERNRLDDGLTVRFWDERVLDDRVTLYGLIEADPAEPPWPLTYDGRVARPARGGSLYVNAHGAAGTELAGVRSAYAVAVLPDTPLELMAVATQDVRTWPDGERTTLYDRWTIVDVDGISENTRLDLTLGDELVPRSFRSSFALPADHSDPLRDDAVASAMRVLATEDGATANPCGFARRVARSDAGDRVELSGEYVMPQLAGGAVTELSAWSPVDGVGSMAWIDGTPDTWSTEPELLPVPELDELLSTEDGTWSLRYDADTAEGVRTYAQVFGNDDSLLWEVIGPEGDELTLPMPPSSVDATSLAAEARVIVPMLVREADMSISHLSHGTPWTLQLVDAAPAPWHADTPRVLPTVQIAVDPDAGVFAPAW